MTTAKGAGSNISKIVNKLFFALHVNYATNKILQNFEVDVKTFNRNKIG